MAERYVSRAEIARQLRVTERTITTWVRDRDFPRRVKGRRVTFPEDRCFAWYVAYKQSEALKRSRSEEPADLDTARARKMEAEARMAEIELAKLEGELIPLDLFEEQLNVILDRLRAKMINLPGRWAPLLLGKRTIQEIIAVLEEAAADAMKALVEIADELEDEDADPHRVD